ncbi:hypothetical protein BDV39DRAFT_105360 [Aspergillus sergii]|uniref:Transmembrane protein n=1 Tax=Aspergillus sergii TaxID=1034303 RepID=A0A5N6WWK2_9EURO|nr:hypothetical protein BDV39DRAFT_105360 [Aspergillus sergii]
MCHITRLHFARAKPLIHSAGWRSSFFRRISVYIIVLPPTVVLKRFVLLFPGQRLQCHRTSASLSFVLFLVPFFFGGHRLSFILTVSFVP